MIVVEEMQSAITNQLNAHPEETVVVRLGHMELKTTQPKLHKNVYFPPRDNNILILIFQVHTNIPGAYGWTEIRSLLRVRDAPFRSGNIPAYRNVRKELKEGSREAGTSSALRGTLTVTTPTKGTGSVYHSTPPL